MTNTFQLRSIIIYLLVLPLSLWMGFLLSQPDNFINLALVGTVMFILALPFLMRWHYSILIFVWNATISAFFLPGQLDLWIVMSALSLFFWTWRRTISRKAESQFVASVGWPLIVLGIIVVITAVARGGLGLNIFGSSSIGSKRYLYIIGAMLGFFALSAQTIEKKRAFFYACLFFISGISAAMSDLIYLAGSNFYFLYNLFPAGLARLQAAHDIVGGESLFRLEGVAWASVAFSCFMLLRYGLREILDFRHPWRAGIFILTVAAGLVGGFRSRLLMIAMLVIVQFCLEGLWRTRWLSIFLGGTALLGISVMPFTNKLPASVQRTLSFLPVEVDPAVKRDADDSTMWRLEMWRLLLPEVPKYLLVGKSYTFSATDLYLTQYAETRGMVKDYESMMLASEFHNGPLSVIIPFGLFGFVAFIWFVGAGWLALYRNYRYGDADFIKINTFFLAYYTVRVFFFFVVYGAFSSELFVFTGVLGLSLAINKGVSKPDVRRTSTNLEAVRPTLEGRRAWRNA